MAGKDDINEDHILKLNLMCRICGENVPHKYGYKKKLFAAEFQSVYGIDIESEPSNLFPQYVCRNDSRMLYRCREAISKENMKNDDFEKSLFVFLPHTEDGCSVCNKTFEEKPPSGKKSKRKPYFGRKKKIDEHDFESEQIAPKKKKVNTHMTKKHDENGVVEELNILVDNVDDTCSSYSKESSPLKVMEENRQKGGEDHDDNSTCMTSTCTTNKHVDNTFDIEDDNSLQALLPKLLTILSTQSSDEKEGFFLDLLHKLATTDLQLFSYCLGKRLQSLIAEDAASFSLQYKDTKAMADFSLAEWLEGRNRSVVSFLHGISNIQFTNEKPQCNLIVGRGVEQLYMLRCPQLICPISFLLNISIYTLTGSKTAVDLLGNNSPAGHYKTVTAWLREQKSDEPSTFDGDVMNVFDNEQVIGRKSAIRPNQKVNTSIITNKGIVLLDSKENEEMLQNQLRLMPTVPLRLSCNEQGSPTNQHDIKLKKAVSEMMNQSSEEITKMEKDHYEQLHYYVDDAIETVHQEQINVYAADENDIYEVEDSIDHKVTKDKLEEDQILCSCGTWNKKRKQICSNCNQREGLKKAKDIKKKTVVPIHEKHTTYHKITFTNDDDSQTCIESSSFDHIPTGHLKSHEIVLTDPVFCNPNSYETVAMVLRKIGKENGIKRYGGTLRHWTFVCCDGLPYTICKRLQEEAVLCKEENCNEKFFTKAKFVAHAQRNHPDKKSCKCIREFDWFYLRIGSGHYEMNLVKSFFELNWIPYLESLCERMGFVSDNAKQYAKACKDHHKSWNLLLIFHTASLRELVLPYVRHCIREGLVPESKQFFVYHIETYKSDNRPNFKYLMDTVCRFSQAIINFRMAIRRNNSDLLKSAKFMSKELFHGRQHPKYQEIELTDTLQDIVMPAKVKDLNDSYSSITTSKNKSTGQDFDFILEEKNRQLKAWIPKGVPTDAIWKTVCRNNTVLEKIKLLSLSLFGITPEKGISKPLDIEDAVFDFRCLLRSNDYINKPGDHTSISNTALDDQLVRFIELASSKRNYHIKRIFLEENIECSAFYRNPIPLTPEERQKIYSTENKTLPAIRNQIEHLLSILPEGIQSDFHCQMYNHEVKTKNKDRHIEFLNALQEATADWTDNPSNNIE